MTDRKERASGVELLRILCMLLIIAHHYSVHGGFSVEMIKQYPGQGLFVQLLGMFGRAACSIFMLMTGFFLVSRKNEHHYRRIVPLVAEQYFYSVVILAVVAAFHLHPMSRWDVVHSLFPAIWGNWYVVAYIMLYMLVPFLNPALLAADRKSYKMLLVTVFVLWSVIPTFTTMDWDFSNLDFFLVMYLTGGYIRLHLAEKANYKNAWNLAAALASAGGMLLSAVLLNKLGRDLDIDYLIDNATYFRACQSILAVAFAISTFLFFSRLRFVSRPVNHLAGSVIGVYLIHDDILLRDLIWMGISPNTAHITSPWLHAPVKILAVFAVCLAIDLLRRATVERVFLKWFQARCDAWDRKRAPGLYDKTE